MDVHISSVPPLPSASMVAPIHVCHCSQFECLILVRWLARCPTPSRSLQCPSISLSLSLSFYYAGALS